MNIIDFDIETRKRITAFLNDFVDVAKGQEERIDKNGIFDWELIYGGLKCLVDNQIYTEQEINAIFKQLKISCYIKNL